MSSRSSRDFVFLTLPPPLCGHGILFPASGLGQLMIPPLLRVTTLVATSNIHSQFLQFAQWACLMTRFRNFTSSIYSKYGPVAHILLHILMPRSTRYNLERIRLKVENYETGLEYDPTANERRSGSDTVSLEDTADSFQYEKDVHRNTMVGFHGN
jgi:hypothetical protein